MAVKTLQYLRSRFETGDIPNQTDFIDLIDSCYNGLTGDDASQILSYVTNFSYFNTFLSVLTSNSLYGTSNEYPVYTNTNLSLTADQINVNLNELEDLVKRSNTLLNTLTGVDYATSSKQNITNSLLNGLTGQTDGIKTLILNTNTLLFNISSLLNSQLGQTGFNFIVGGETASSGPYSTVQIVSAAKIAAMSASNTTVGKLTSFELPVNFSFNGPFTSITLVYGAAIVYKL
jgi:hypothetical protein